MTALRTPFVSWFTVKVDAVLAKFVNIELASPNKLPVEIEWPFKFKTAPCSRETLLLLFNAWLLLTTTAIP